MLLHEHFQLVLRPRAPPVGFESAELAADLQSSTHRAMAGLPVRSLACLGAVGDPFAAAAAREPGALRLLLRVAVGAARTCGLNVHRADCCLLSVTKEKNPL